MKIFYAVQATGNGHISRAMQLMPYLKQYGEVDVFLSGANATLQADLPVKYRSNGLSLFYSTCGGLDFKRMWNDNSILRAHREAKDLPIDQYDVIINDFDYITAKACKLKNKASIQFGHQASFLSRHTPRPDKTNFFGEMVLKHYAKASNYLGLHFKRYDDFIQPPIIKTAIVNADVTNKGHVTVYLPAYEKHCLEKMLVSMTDIHFHWFLHGTKSIEKIGNITYYPVDNHMFNESLISCEGLITGGGFETPAEALFLQKKLVSIPIQSQYEQQCNAAALARLGVKTMKSAKGETFKDEVYKWLNAPALQYKQEANNIPATLEYLFHQMRPEQLIVA